MNIGVDMVFVKKVFLTIVSNNIAKGSIKICNISMHKVD